MYIQKIVKSRFSNNEGRVLYNPVFVGRTTASSILEVIEEIQKDFPNVKTEDIIIEEREGIINFSFYTGDIPQKGEKGFVFE